jgi:hypothetical protein
MPQPNDEVPDPALEDARRLEHETRPVLVQLDRVEGALDHIAADLTEAGDPAV